MSFTKLSILEDILHATCTKVNTVEPPFDIQNIDGRLILIAEVANVIEINKKGYNN